jgi:hypothetical protein
MGTPTKVVLTLRAPRELADRVRAIAAEEAETDSTILRRLLRRGLDVTEQRAVAAADRG